MKRFFFLWFVPLTFLFTPQGSAQEVQRKTLGPATLTIHAPIKNGRLSLRLSDLLVVTLEVLAPDERKVEEPIGFLASPRWNVHKETPLGWRQSKPGEKLWHRKLWLEPLAPGDQPLSFKPWKLVGEKDDFREVFFDEVTVSVSTVVTEADLKKSRDITPPEDLPPPSTHLPWWLWLLGGGLLLLLFLAGWAVGRCWRQAQARPVPQARDWSLAHLDRLLARLLPEKNHERGFLSLLSLILRGYLERVTQVPARRLTTGELLPLLDSVPQGQRQVVSEVLQRADLIRFAGVKPDPGECAALAERVRGFFLAFPPAKMRLQNPQAPG